MKNKSELAELHQLFTIKYGNKFDLNKMEACPASNEAIAFVGRSGGNNGVVSFVKKHNGAEPFTPGLITVALGGAALSSFVQAQPFYTAQNIDVLEPKAPMSLDVRLFYCLCIEANAFRYGAFGREANRTLRNLLVPVIEVVPGWVNGMAAKAADELSRDLHAALKDS